MKNSHILVGVRDLKSNLIRGPYILRTEAEFIRAIQDEAKNLQSDLCKHPNDFRLEVYCQWDEFNGLLSSDLAEFKSLGVVYDFINVSQN